MRYRLIFSAAVSAVALGVLAPQTVAAPPQQLAPGLSCQEFGCHNNDPRNTYLVHAPVICSNGAPIVTGTAYVPPRSTAPVRYSCPMVQGPPIAQQQTPIVQPDGSIVQRPPVWESGPMIPSTGIGVIYRNAQVITNPPPPAGSSGG